MTPPREDRSARARAHARPRPNRPRPLAPWLLFATLSLWASAVLGEDVDTQRFLPHATSGGYLVTEGSELRNRYDPFSLGTWLSYGHQPLIAVRDGELVEALVAHQVGLDVTASYALASWLELGAHLPLAYLAGEEQSAAALGDLRLLPKLGLLDDRKRAVGLALLPELRLPTHTDRFYGGARLPAFAPRLLLDHRFGASGFRAGLDLGALLRQATELRNVEAGSELSAGLGLGYRFAGGRSPVELLLDLRSALGLAETDAEEIALEGLLGASYEAAPDLRIHGGAGLGLLEGFGVPTSRVFLGVRWEPSPNDPDRDGVPSPRREQRVFRISHAPPVPADDPGLDEPVSADDIDNAALKAAIAGGYDACPDMPEDFDGIEDDDGCPEGDADRDGVLDYLDRCPEEAETINGFEDDDGCEDEGPAKIVIEEGRLIILETIRFEFGSAQLDRVSRPIVDQIALMLRRHQEIEHVQVGGHTDSTGPRRLNMQLSRERARTVRLHLLQRGIKPSRVSARGYGPDRPVADNATEQGRARNRRVEFLFRH